MMGYVGTLAIVGGGDSPGSLISDRKCWNGFILISGDAAAGAEDGSGYLCGVQIVGKALLNFFRPYMCASGGVSSMKTLDGMKVPVAFTILLIIHPRRKASSAWMSGSLRLSRLLYACKLLWSLGLC